MANLPITSSNVAINIPTPTTGWDAGIYKINYVDIEALRVEMFDVSGYINLLRDETGINNIFENVLPPVITTGNIRTGCVKLPDPNCLTTYTFAAAMDKERIVDTVIGPCNVALLGNKIAQYASDGVNMWALDEAKHVFQFIGSTLGTAESVASGTNIRVAITDAILELEQKLFEELGDLAPRRDRFRVLVSRNAENELANSQYVCCNWNMVEANPLANLFGVEAVIALPLNLMPTGYDIIVYVPNFLFLKTMCKIKKSINKYAPMLGKLA